MSQTIPSDPVVAALFVEPNGSYRDVRVDLWDESRDARKYTGSLPVIAHPPCSLWSKFANINYSRWGGDHNKPGNDGGCFLSALNNVNRCGGVLEHPAGSKAWGAYGLVRPTQGVWTNSGDGWVTQVWQSAYGHRANKKTWLYYRGDAKPFDMVWTTPQGSHKVGWYKNPNTGSKGKPSLQRGETILTPPKFMACLFDLAVLNT